MSLNRYATKRDLNEPEIVAALRAVGATVVQMDKPVDLLVGYKRQTLLMEVKQPGKKVRSGEHKHGLTIAQQRFFREWQGGDLLTVRSVEQALACLGIKDSGVEIGERVEVKGVGDGAGDGINRQRRWENTMKIETENIEPLGSLVLIRVPQQRETSSGLYIPETSRLYGGNVAEVIAVGPGDMLRDAETGANHWRKAELEPGDFVLLRYNSEQAEIRVDDGGDGESERISLVDPSVCLAKLRDWKPGQVVA